MAAVPHRERWLSSGPRNRRTGVDRPHLGRVHRGGVARGAAQRRLRQRPGLAPDVSLRSDRAPARGAGRGTAYSPRRPERARRLRAFGAEEHTKRVFSTLLPVPAHGQRVDFDRNELPLVRGVVGRIAQASGLSPAATENLTLAVHEVAANSVVHGSGVGALWFWEERTLSWSRSATADTSDDPLVGRRVPDLMQEGGWPRGLDSQPAVHLVQIRSSTAGTQVRIRMWTGSRRPVEP